MGGLLIFLINYCAKLQLNKRIQAPLKLTLQFEFCRFDNPLITFNEFIDSQILSEFLVQEIFQRVEIQEDVLLKFN